MTRQSAIETWNNLPPWQQRAYSYLELGPNPRPRPTWRRVLSGVAAAFFLVAGVANLATGRWWGVGQLVIAVVAALGTTRTSVGARLWRDDRA